VLLAKTTTSSSRKVKVLKGLGKPLDLHQTTAFGLVSERAEIASP